MKRCLRCQHHFTADDWRCPACGDSPLVRNGYTSFSSPEAGDGFYPEYFAELAALEEGNFWFLSRNALIIRTLQRHAPQMASYLEIGCGTGFVLSGVGRSFPHAQLTGSDYFGEALPVAAQRVPQARLGQIDARELPFADAFDAIGIFDVLEHIVEDENVLSQCYRSLRVGGCVVLTVPQHPWLWSTADRQACHVRRYRRNELLEKLVSAGFRPEYVTSFVSLLLPVMTLLRLFPRDPIATPDPLAALRIHPALNRLFSSVMAVEQWLMRCGVRFRSGGSLLVVGRKPDDGKLHDPLQ